MKKWFSKVLSLLVVAAGAVIGVWFYLDNMETVTVHWFGHPIENVQLALWLLIFFVAGALLGLSVSAVQAMRHQVHVKVLRNQVKATKPKSVSTI
ncbi:MAG: LapA family protein [Pseudomonadales bacterium]